MNFSKNAKTLYMEGHTDTSLLRKGEQLENVKDIAKFTTDYLILAQVHYPQYVKSIHTLLKIPSVSYCSVTSDYGYSFIFYSQDLELKVPPKHATCVEYLREFFI